MYGVNDYSSSVSGLAAMTTTYMIIVLVISVISIIAN